MDYEDQEFEDPMTTVDAIVPEEILKVLPRGVGDLEINPLYIGGQMQWVQDTYVITSQDQTMELALGHFEDEGIMKEMVFMNETGQSVTRQNATMAVATVYGEHKEKVEVSTLLFGGTK